MGPAVAAFVIRAAERSIGFTDARAGAALVPTPFDASVKAGSQSLWRTSDGGAHWSAVRLR